MASLDGRNFAVKAQSPLGLTDCYHSHFNNDLKRHIFHLGNRIRKIFWQRSQEKLSAILLGHLHLCPVHMVAFAKGKLGWLFPVAIYPSWDADPWVAQFSQTPDRVDRLNGLPLPLLSKWWRNNFSSICSRRVWARCRTWWCHWGLKISFPL